MANSSVQSVKSPSKPDNYLLSHTEETAVDGKMEEPSIKHISLLSIKNDDISRSANINMALTEKSLDNVLRQEYTLSHMRYKPDQLTLHGLHSPGNVSPMDVDQVCDNDDELKNDISKDLMQVEENASCSEYSLKLNRSDRFEFVTIRPKDPRTRNVSTYNFSQRGYNYEGSLRERINDLKKKIIDHKTKKRNHIYPASTVVSKGQDKQVARVNLGKNVVVFKTVDLMNISRALINDNILFLNCNISNTLLVKRSLPTYSGIKLFVNEICRGQLREVTLPYNISYGMCQSLIGLIQSLLLKERVHTNAAKNKKAIGSVAEENTYIDFSSNQNLLATTLNTYFRNNTSINLSDILKPNIGSLMLDSSEIASGSKIIEIDEPDIHTNSATIDVDMIPVKSNLKRKIQTQANTKKNKLVKSGLRFTNVTTFYFERSQGFSSIPTKGGSTLGMANQHFHISTLALDEYENRKMLGEVRRRRKSVFYRKTDIRDRQRCVQALNLNQRIELLESSEIQIEEIEEDDCAHIRSSRASAGCDCKDYCDPDVCGCSLAGIECQVDRPNFPCGCSKENCKNLMGRNEYNHSKVRSHFTKTIRKIKLESKGRVSKRKQASPSKIFIKNRSHEMDIDMYEV